MPDQTTDVNLVHAAGDGTADLRAAAEAISDFLELVAKAMAQHNDTT